MYSLLVLAALGPSAPAPRPRPAQPITRAEVIGLWQLKWGTATWETRFSSDGHYACWANGFTWIGSWQLDGDVLTVTERTLESSYSTDPPPGYVWKVRLSRARQGCLQGAVSPPGPGVTIQLSPALPAAR